MDMNPAARSAVTGHNPVESPHQTRGSPLMPRHVILLLLVLTSVPGAVCHAAADDPHDAAVKRCTALKGLDLAEAPEAPARILEAAASKIADDVPEVCMVDGYISPNTGFRIALPLEGWNGKYLQGGCGGACGTTKLFWCEQPLRRGYACASTDMGHRSSIGDWNWAANDLETKADFGFRATHLMAVVGKALTKRYLGADPSHSYFMGCSTGGRQALVEAEHFPWDFDGIIAGAPPLDEIGTGFQLAWSVKANLDDAGNPVLTESLVHLLHDAVVKACDLNDGLADGLIGDPRLCKFDIGTLACKGAADGACLTATQIAAAKKIYSGPMDARGRPVGRTGGAMLGSELFWLGDYVAGNGRQPQYLPFIQNFIRFAAFDPAVGTAWELKDLDPAADSRRVGMNEFLFDATNPDLRSFKAAGGKLLGFQGWGDTSVVPMQYVDYYETVTRLMGGAKNTLDFYRFFTVPGMRHCSSDGAGGDMIDYLAALEDWVERGSAPDVLIGSNFDWNGVPLRSPVFPIDRKRVRFTRPAYLYPAFAVYKGKGDPHEAGSFRRSTVGKPPAP
jgi:feruloyl esterase